MISWVRLLPLDLRACATDCRAIGLPGRCCALFGAAGLRRGGLPGRLPPGALAPCSTAPGCRCPWVAPAWGCCRLPPLLFATGRSSSIHRAPARGSRVPGPTSALARLPLCRVGRPGGGPAIDRQRGVRPQDEVAGQGQEPQSRRISAVYAVWPAATSPPPPKHPQSMDRPRAAAEITPAMKITSTTADSTAASRVASPTISSSPSAISRNGSTAATGSDQRLRQQVVRPDRDDGLPRVHAFGTPESSQTAPRPSRASSPRTSRTTARVPGPWLGGGVLGAHVSRRWAPWEPARTRSPAG